MGASRANARARSTSSSSFTPAITTAFTLTESNPAAAAARIAAMVSSHPSRKVISRKRSGRSVSRERLTASSPPARRTSRCCRRSSALEVIASRCRPYDFSLPRRATRSSTPRRTNGSPPVTRILRTPSRTNSVARRSISSKESKSPLGSNGTPSSGMQ